MSDNHTREQRSYNMSLIKGKNTKPEETVRKALFSKGFRYRKNVRSLPGCPDIVLTKYRTVVFVNGCFWHKHNCPKFVWPSSNTEYWEAKIMNNVKRDTRNIQLLSDLGWNVITIWECELKKNNVQDTINRLIKAIIGGTPNGRNQFENDQEN